MTGIAAGLSALTGCRGELAIVDPAGPAARSISLLWWGMVIWFGLVLLAVTLLWIYSVHVRPRSGRAVTEPAVIARGAPRWIVGGGVLLPLITVTILLLLGLPAGHRMAAPAPDALVIEVTGHQWWWEIRYPDGEVITANHLVMPAGEPVILRLTSADVIHSFWVPRLAGKMDMIPGHTNRLRLEADQPGLYRGQCSEFCGAQHARMLLTVEALPEPEFSRWLSRRQQFLPPSPASKTLAQFSTHCGDCHRVSGLTRGLSGGPDLTDIGARPTLGAGTLTMSEPGALLRWLQEHRRLKPDNRMVAPPLPAAELSDIAAWLEQLVP